MQAPLSLLLEFFFCRATTCHGIRLAHYNHHHPTHYHYLHSLNPPLPCTHCNTSTYPNRLAFFLSLSSVSESPIEVPLTHSQHPPTNHAKSASPAEEETEGGYCTATHQTNETCNKTHCQTCHKTCNTPDHKTWRTYNTSNHATPTPTTTTTHHPTSHTQPRHTPTLLSVHFEFAKRLSNGELSDHLYSTQQ